MVDFVVSMFHKRVVESIDCGLIKRLVRSLIERGIHNNPISKYDLYSQFSYFTIESITIFLI